MADTIKTVKSAGGDYSSLSAWEAGQQKVISAGDVEIAECYSFSDTSAVTIDGWTTVATGYIEIRTPLEERHDGKWNSSKYRLEVNDDYAAVLNIVEDYVRIIGLQLDIQNTTFALGISYSGAGVCSILNNIIQGSSTAADGQNGIELDNLGNGTVNIINNIIYTCRVGISVDYPSGTSEEVNIYNNTLYGNGYGVSIYEVTTLNIKNNISYGNVTSDYVINFSGTQVNSANLSEDATSPDVAFRSKTLTFVDTTTFDLHLVVGDTDAINQADDLSADAAFPFSDDVDGGDRSSWDIGADEYGAVGGIITSQEGFRWRNDDGNETSATWLAAQDTGSYIPLNTNVRLRILLDTSGDASSFNPTLYYKKVGEGSYVSAPTAAVTTGTISLFGVAKDPTTDNTANVGPTAVIVPPGSMVAGQLVTVFVCYRGTTGTLSVSNAGGQSWTNATQVDSGNFRIQLFKCIFDGTWDANPSFTITTGTNAILGYMMVWDGADETTPYDVDFTNGGTSTASTFSVPAVTTTTDGAVAVVMRISQDNNSYGTFTTGWSSPASQHRVTSTTGLGFTWAYKTLATAGSSGDYASTQSALGPDTSIALSFAIKRSSTTNRLYVATSSNITASGEATTALLTPPTGKTTGDFQTGRMWDDENGTDSIDLTTDKYTEFEWNLKFQSPAVDTEEYDFRLYKGAAVLNNYLQSATITIGTAPSTTRRVFLIN